MAVTLAIVATGPSEQAANLKEVLTKAAQQLGCRDPRVAIWSEWPNVRVEVDCPVREEGYL